MLLLHQHEFSSHISNNFFNLKIEQITLISDENFGGAKDAVVVRSPLFVAFKIPDLHSSPPVLRMEWAFHS